MSWKKCLFSCRIFHLNSQFFKLWDKTYDDQEYASTGIWKGIYWEKNKTISHGNSIDKSRRHQRCLTGPSLVALNLKSKNISSQSSEVKTCHGSGSAILPFKSWKCNIHSTLIIKSISTVKWRNYIFLEGDIARPIEVFHINKKQKI